jgi:hypothetical protein
VYEYSFDPDTMAGRPNLDTLYRMLSPTVGHLYGLGTEGVYQTVTSLSYNDSYEFGAKEVALMLCMRGRYFGDDRSMVVSARMRTTVPYVIWLDVWPPRLHRAAWSYSLPEDGDTIDAPFFVSLQTSADECAQGRNTGWINDQGGGMVVAADMVFARVSDPFARSWRPYDSFKQVSLSQFLSLPQHTFPLEIAHPDSIVCATTWGTIDPTAWIDGYYLMAFITEDSFGNRGFGPYFHFRGYNEDPTSSNPQLLRIMTNNHGY